MKGGGGARAGHAAPQAPPRWRAPEGPQGTAAVLVGAFIVAAVLTPPDVLSQFMLAIPLMLLYELGIFLGGFLSAHSQAPEDLPDDPSEESGAIVPAADSQVQQTGNDSSR